MTQQCDAKQQCLPPIADVCYARGCQRNSHGHKWAVNPPPGYLSNNSIEGDETSMRVMSGAALDSLFCLILCGFAGLMRQATQAFCNHR